MAIKDSLRLVLSVAVLAVSSLTCAVPTSPVDNLHAFAELYGYVRFFHPSDAAAGIDWDRFAVYGAEKVRDAATRGELLADLRELFHPIAPTIQLYRSNDRPPDPIDTMSPDDTVGLHLVSWQHRGVGLGTNALYESRRTHRPVADSERADSVVMLQGVAADGIPGPELRLTAMLRAESHEGGAAQIFLSLSDADRPLGSHTSEEVGPAGASWQTAEVRGALNEDAGTIVLGVILNGAGRVSIDSVRLESGSSSAGWENVRIRNGDFEDTPVGYPPEGWLARAHGYVLRTISRSGDGGGSSALLSSVDDLFESRKSPGHIVEKDIGSGLSVQLPVSLYSRDGRTIDVEDGDSAQDLRRILAASDIDLAANTPANRMAGVAIGWSILQHFYPYFDVVDVDWERVLDETILDALDDKSPRDYAETLQRMMAKLEDGHGNASHPTMDHDGLLPMRPELIDGRLVVVATGALSPVRPGDILVTVDGIPTLEYMADRLERESGSPQFRRFRALSTFGRGPRSDTVRVSLLRSGDEVEVQLRRNSTSISREVVPPPISELEDGIYYVDLTAVSDDQLKDSLDVLSGAAGVIFDLRGYPGYQYGLLSHLTDRTISSSSWDIPLTEYPDREHVRFDTTSRWRIDPRQPRITGEIVFLTNESAVSQAESILEIVEHERLGTIVGRPTAGTNGDVNWTSLPGGATISFTGLRVLKQNGERLHLVGVIPQVPVDRTLAAVTEGRDEYIEAALDVLRGRGDH